MALEAIVNQEGAYRIVLEEYPEGVYVLVYATAASEWPCKDYLQDDWRIAKLAAFQQYDVTDHQWNEIPDTKFNG